jgi:hypothetical protein
MWKNKSLSILNIVTLPINSKTSTTNKQSIVLKCFNFIWNLLVRAKNSVNYYEYPVDIRNSSVAANIDKNGIYYILLNI